MSTEVKYPYYNRPELWGGIECTINRVNDVFRDQLDCAGHYTRLGDIDKFALLGITMLRYPVLWERHMSSSDQKLIDWTWTEQQLNRIREHNIIPIAGLIHHGSGPSDTSLLDPLFPKKLAAYALKVARKFPWLEYYTPVNEPLTTARFSGLYGIWYPHHKSPRSFVCMLLNQLKAVVLGMKAIRTINPAAKLIQTEDLAKIHSTPLLKYQAAHENIRRWLTFDLLCGKLNHKHDLWNYLIANGASERELKFFIDNPCPPHIIGFNYYVTSERFLDEKKEKYPSFTHGGNGRHSYADTEAVRAGCSEGIEVLMKEAWERFNLPLAVTECHLSCSREEQMRWFYQNYQACKRLCNEGIPVKAVTAWSLLGAFDWNSLLSCRNNNYESGVFDIKGGGLRETALAGMIRHLSRNGDYDHPLLEGAGWWEKTKKDTLLNLNRMKQKPPVLIIGRNGTLGAAFMKICERRSINHIALSRKELDIVKEEDIHAAINTYKPWAIINATGYVRVDDAESDSNECFAINAVGPALLASVCKTHGIRFMTFSSDLVFDGSKNSPYHERDGVMPLNIYGSSKAQGEKFVNTNLPSALIIRTSAFFGPWDKYNFVYTVLDSLKNGKPLYMANDVIVSPTYVPDLADTALDLFIDEEEGIWHLTNEGMTTWAEFGYRIASHIGITKSSLYSRRGDEMDWIAKRPTYSVLQSEKGIKMPPLENALVRYFEQRSV